MFFAQGVYEIAHDPERTRHFYVQAPDTLCDCSGCRNFRASVSQMTEALRAFLDQFGIDPAKPAEMSVLYAPAEDEVFYDGFYHFCGEIRAGLKPHIQIGEKSFQLDQKYLLCVGGAEAAEHAWFEAQCALIDPDFPRPAVQLNVFFHLPWVLEEENTYL